MVAKQPLTIIRMLAINYHSANDYRNDHRPTIFDKHTLPSTSITRADNRGDTRHRSSPCHCDYYYHHCPRSDDCCSCWYSSRCCVHCYGHWYCCGRCAVSRDDCCCAAHSSLRRRTRRKWMRWYMLRWTTRKPLTWTPWTRACGRERCCVVSPPSQWYVRHCSEHGHDCYDCSRVCSES